MSETPDNLSEESDEKNFPTRSLSVTLISAIVCAVSGYFWYSTGADLPAIICLISQTVLVSILIWQACDPFADTAQYIGHELKLPGSVRGATLDAIASSMPELFTGLFFVIVAVLFGRDGLSAAEAGGLGFSLTIATCAGSAVYNMILIPAICAIFISYYRPSRPTIDIEHRVITRDGAWFVGMELLLITFLFQRQIHWWMGVVFLLGYAAYVIVLYYDARFFRRQVRQIEELIDTGMSGLDAIKKLESDGTLISRDLSRRFEDNPGLTPEDLEELEDDDDEQPDTAGVLFGFFNVGLNRTSAWVVIGLSTIVAAAACYWLVEITTVTAERLNVPVFFIAVILAAAASSVPDTFLSVASAKSGDDDGAVSNAFGSNIFDISICISIPLLVASYLNGWEPITLTDNGSIVSLQVMLAVLTLITLAVIWHRLQLTRKKAFFLCGLYVVFIGYAILGSTGVFTGS